jgi:hypothetical protein
LSSSPQPLFSAFPGDFLIEKTAGMSNRFLAASHYGTPEAQSNLSDRLPMPSHCKRREAFLPAVVYKGQQSRTAAAHPEQAAGSSGRGT